MTVSGRAKTSTKKRAQQRGRWAEVLARTMLKLKGHKILAKNYKTKVGEIDIITRKNNVIGFVEVKARRSEREAAEAISQHQKSRIERTAEHFMVHQPEHQNCDMRFDVALVTGPVSIHILYDAWRP
ncbi:MAG: YraN family protein [Rhodospirillaceae bacterium]|nr:MAG: YraN family protein [Rhodospirillaceae bacterium]